MADRKNNDFSKLKEDWRYIGQDEYLANAKLMYRKFKDSDGDHDHCEFCWAKFSKFDGDLHEGYCTLDKYAWICETCFNDFNEMFEWKVVR